MDKWGKAYDTWKLQGPDDMYFICEECETKCWVDEMSSIDGICPQCFDKVTERLEDE
jgi:transcription initiation factor IIE alpha subunit